MTKSRALTSQSRFYRWDPLSGLVVWWPACTSDSYWHSSLAC